VGGQQVDSIRTWRQKAANRESIQRNGAAAVQHQLGQRLTGGRPDLETGAAEPKPCSRPICVVLGPITGCWSGR
jgi:hypothetical protein